MSYFINTLFDSPIIQIIIIIYTFYAAIIGLCIASSTYLIIIGLNNFVFPVNNIFKLIELKKIIGFALIFDISIYLYFISGIIIMGILIRIVSLGIKHD